MKNYILHLETATKVCSVALSENGKLVALKETQEEGYSHGENLNLFIQEVIGKAGISLNDLAAVSLASGPGSYTGLRIGAATAKALCYSLHIPLIAIDALTCLTELARIRYPGETICAVIDARRMEVYNLFVDAAGNHLKEISADIVDAHSYGQFVPFVCVGDGTGKLQEVWSGREITMDPAIVSGAAGQVRVAYQKYLDKIFEDVAYWEPFYLKDFIAGTPKR